MSVESPIPLTFLPIEIELNWSDVRVPIHLYSAPPRIDTLIYHLMGLFTSYLTRYNHAKWNLAFSIVISKRNSGRQQTFKAAAIVLKKSDLK